jgi:hypothetical protein
MTTNARSKATYYLANAFKELRITQSIDVLKFWDIYLDGFVQGLEAVGRITKEQAEKIIEQRDKIYESREELLIKEESRQRYNTIG